MTDSLNQSIDRIRTWSPRLNKITDEAAAVVARVEGFLNAECSVGIPAYVVHGEPNGRPAAGHIELCYCRVQGKYRIAVRGHYCGTDDMIDERTRPWASCPRDVKLRTIADLPKLLETIAGNITSATDQTREAIEAVNQVLEAIDGKHLVSRETN